MKTILYVLVALITITGWGQNEGLFEKGKEFYKVENYQEAMTTWTQIVAKGEHSVALYYNLGNAHYKLNNIGPSIYYFEKALQLDPNDADVKNNLAFAKNATIDVIEPLPKTFFSQWYENTAGVFSFEGWAIQAVIFSFVFVILFLLYYFTVIEKRKRLFFVGAICSFLLLLAALALAFQTYSDSLSDNPAIIFAESTEVKSEPTMGGEVAFVLHEGTKVQVLAEDGDWLRIQLIDGKDGWIPAEDLKQL